jgi:hypothetical protein
MPLKAGYLLVGAGGIALLWSGLRGKSWSVVVRDLLSGKNPTSAANVNALNGGTFNAGGGVGNAGNRGFSNSVPGSSLGGAGGPDTISPPAVNQALGRMMAVAYGWSAGTEWKALNFGWGSLESGWNNRIYYGGQVGGPYQPGLAYGIPAFLGHGPNGAPFPGGSPANPPGAGGDSSPANQIKQGFEYIKSRYGSPSNVPGWLGQPGYQGY